MTPRQANVLIRLIAKYRADLPPHELSALEDDALAALYKTSRKRMPNK